MSICIRPAWPAPDSRLGSSRWCTPPKQRQKQQGLIDASVALYMWESSDLDTPSASNGSPIRWLRRMLKIIYTFARTWPRRPQDTLLQDWQFANLSGPIFQALNDTSWQALVVAQSNCARWIDYLPCFPVSVLVMHDVRAMVYERCGPYHACPGPLVRAFVASLVISTF